MKKVKVNGPGVKLANKWCFIGDEAIIDDEEYNKMEKYVELIEDIEEPEKEPTMQEEITGSESKEESDGKPEEHPEGKPEGEDEELEALKERAKELGINVTHNMKKETIIKKIEEAEKAEAGENQNPKGE